MEKDVAGWFYVGDGKLRYRDEHGWTEFYLDTTDRLAQDWPPPAPLTMVREVLDDEARRAAAASPRRFFRTR